MNILLETQNLLSKNNYIVKTTDIYENALVFEDESIIGFAVVFDSIITIIDNWEKIQDKFLITYEGQLRKIPEKAWNVYTIYLAHELIDKSQKEKIYSIEEDLRGTRKIVITGIDTKIDIEKALLPILPIQKSVNMKIENYQQRLREGIEISDLFEYDNIEKLYLAIENKS